MKVTVFGTGYVGLVQGAVLADVGHQVLCVDVDEKKIAALKAGQIPIHEPGLDALVINNQRNRSPSVHHQRRRRRSTQQLIFLAVGTPPDEDGSADLNMCWPR